MSRIKVMLILPKVDKEESDIGRTVKIETDGVVVREHPVIKSGKIAHYDVAVFFDNISVKDREAIRNYINRKVDPKK